MDIDEPTVAYIAGGIIAIGATFIQHMAFRSPYWRAQELTRRAIGIGTVLGLYGIFGVLWAGGDLVTYLGIVGYFVVAGIVKLGHEWVDKARKAPLVGRLHHDDTSAAE